MTNSSIEMQKFMANHSDTIFNEIRHAQRVEDIIKQSLKSNEKTVLVEETVNADEEII